MGAGIPAYFKTQKNWCAYRVVTLHGAVKRVELGFHCRPASECALACETVSSGMRLAANMSSTSSVEAPAAMSTRAALNTQLRTLAIACALCRSAEPPSASAWSPAAWSLPLPLNSAWKHPARCRENRRAGRRPLCFRVCESAKTREAIEQESKT